MVLSADKFIPCSFSNNLRWLDLCNMLFPVQMQEDDAAQFTVYHLLALASSIAYHFTRFKIYIIFK